MGQIRLLPPDVVNRIAAGEVIERPASVVKELVENSIDAGATEVLVEVEEGGLQRIRVRDNGSGMPPEDLPLAFRSHATSKLHDLVGVGARPLEEDSPGAAGFGLIEVETLGFRGEALASIASVAELEAFTRVPGAECGWRYRLRGAVAVSSPLGPPEGTGGGGEPPEGPEPAAGPPGTSLEVRNLFFNTPARRKFLRSTSTELSHIVETLTRLALGFPGIRFTLLSGGRTLLECPPASTLRERIRSLVGRERAADLLELAAPEEEDVPKEVRGPVKVSGFVGHPRLHRPDARGQHFFVQGRWVRDRVLSHALQEAYRGFQIPGQRPLAYLFVEVPRGALDVNVHPTKCEVRFVDSGSVHRAAYRAVRRALEGARGESPPSASPSELGPSAPGGAPPPAELRERVRAAALDFLSSPPAPARTPAEAAGCGPHPLAGTERAAGGPERLPPARPAAGRRPPVQILARFVALEVEEGLLLYDQHALHEKVLYERILEGLEKGTMPRQRLLVPEVVDLPPELAPLLGQTAAELAPLGFEVEEFGPGQAAVHAVPAVLDQTPAGPIVLEAARWLRQGPVPPPVDAARDGEGAGPDPVGRELRRLARMVACRRAVKAGDPLATGEMEALLRQSEAARDPRYCPHGRPTAVLLPLGELERRFERR